MIRLPVSQKIMLYLIVILGLMLSGAVVSLAQDSGQTPALVERFVSSDGEISFYYPAGWEVSDDDGVTLTNPAGGLTVSFIAPSLLFISPNPDEAVGALFTSRSEQPEIMTADLARGVTTRTVAYGDSDDGSVVYGIKFTDDNVGFVEASGPALLLLEGTLTRIIATYDSPEFTESACLVGVSEDAAGTVVLYVGPDENRGQVGLMIAGQNFAPLGQATEDDGDLWLRLPEDATGPTQAEQIWVNSEDIQLFGICDEIPDAEAPPIRPAAVADDADAEADAAEDGA